MENLSVCIVFGPVEVNTKSKFESRLNAVRQSPKLNFPQFPNILRWETSIGSMILAKRYGFPASFHPMEKEVLAFMREHPWLFVSGSNSEDMTPMGMPPLSEELKADLEAARSAFRWGQQPADEIQTLKKQLEQSKLDNEFLRKELEIQKQRHGLVLKRALEDREGLIKLVNELTV